jgi:hypothetical protein
MVVRPEIVKASPHGARAIALCVSRLRQSCVCGVCASPARAAPRPCRDWLPAHIGLFPAPRPPVVPLCEDQQRDNEAHSEAHNGSYDEANHRKPHASHPEGGNDEDQCHQSQQSQGAPGHQRQHLRRCEVVLPEGGYIQSNTKCVPVTRRVSQPPHHTPTANEGVHGRAGVLLLEVTEVRDIWCS